MKTILFAFCINLLLFQTFLVAQEPVLSNPEVQKIGSGFNFTEGPLWLEGEGLIFSDIPENTVFLLNTDSAFSEYVKPSGKSNGLAQDLDGNLLLCQHLERQVGIMKNETVETFVSHYDGKKLNSPNDLCVKSNGTVFFTDPPFGLNDEGGTSELGFAGIYSVTVDGRVHLLDKSMKYPNGIIFSNDESKLYVVDSEVADIYVYDVVNDSTIENKTLFYNNPSQWGDGMKIDEYGYLYTTANNGLSILTPNGELFKKVSFGSNNPSNCCWGSVNGEPTLYITAGNSIYRVRNKEIIIGTKKKINKESFKIYPNPSNGVINIEVNLAAEQLISIRLIDASGKELNNSICKDSFTHNGYYSLELKQAGLYYFIAQTEKETYTDKIVVF